MFAFRGVQKGVGLSKIIASSRRRRGYWHGAAAAAAASKMNGKTCNNYLRPPSAAAVGIRFFFSPSSSTEINNNNGINMDPTLAQVGTTTTSGGGGGGDLLPSSSSSSSRSARRGRGSPAILLQQLKHHQPNAIVPVSAIHAAQTIDLHKLMTQQQLSSSDVFDERKSSSSSSSSTTKQMFGKNSIVIRLADNDEDSVGTATTTTATDRSNSAARYVAVFRFGSIVFFNVAPPDAAKMTRAIKKLAASEPVPVGAERKEQFGVLVTRDLDTAAMTALEQEAQHQAFLEPVTGDYCVVPELDMNGVAVISTIMAQTVALDSYSDTVDELLTNFARINSTVSKTGSFTSTDKSFLFKTVAQNNSIFIDMISKVRIKDRSDTAWNLTKYETIHYGLKEEFELEDRFENIEFKLNLIQKNAKFFLEVLHHQKSNNLEWIIVALILAECILMCVEMSGKGGALFSTLSGLLPSFLLSSSSSSHKTEVSPLRLDQNEAPLSPSSASAS